MLPSTQTKLELYRAHIPPCTWHLHCIHGRKINMAGLNTAMYVYVWRSLPGNLCALAENTWPAVVGMVNGIGYDTISQIPRCPDLVILVMTTTDRQNQLLYPLCMRAGNKFCSTFHCTLLHEDVYFFLFQLPFSDIQLLSSYVADMPSLSAPWSVQVVC